MKLINKILLFFYHKSSSERYISYLKKKGIRIGKGVIFRDPHSTAIDLTRPSLIEIGDFVDMNTNFTILTHDFGTSVFIRKYNEFINSSGKVTVGNNIYFGKACTILKGVTINDNCIIGANSLITKNIPENSVVAGIPAKVICSIDEYFEKRKNDCIEEAFEYARSIKERFNRKPKIEDFFEEFPLFIDGCNSEKFPEIPIKYQLNSAYDNWKKSHKAKFSSFEDFLIAAGL